MQKNQMSIVLISAIVMTALAMSVYTTTSFAMTNAWKSE
jgi:flagellar basal body-associated protein FliL